MEFESLFEEFAIILTVAVATGMLAIRLRQPLIVAFIAVGIALGPSAFNLVEHNHAMELLAEFGIALLLFVVGLRLDLNLIKTMGPVAVATGLGQITFTSIFVFLICQLLGMAVVPSLYVAAAMSFSSTIIIVKLLSDKREIDSLHGRIAIGFLIVQDIMVVITMIVITALGAAGAATSLPAEVTSVLAKGAAMLVIVVILTRYVLPVLLFQAARSTELLVLFSIALAIGLAAFSHWIGFSKEVGAFLGGIALASTQYREAIGSRLTSVRDFLLLFFFIALGTQLDMALLGLQIPVAVLLSAFVLIGNPLIVLTIMGLMGFRRRTSFLSGLAVAQISEFSLILAALGLSLGHIGDDSVGLITLVALITITLSTYMILYSHQLFDFLAPALKPFERKHPTQELYLEQGESQQNIDLILFGLGRYGMELAEHFANAGRSVLAVDFDPVIIRSWRNPNIQAVYGDAEDPDFLAALPVRTAQWVVSAIPEERVNRTLANGLREEGFTGKLALTSHHESVAKRLSETGADLFLFPYRHAAAQAAYLIGDKATPSDS
ncbi:MULTISPECIES: cation:proton antiporter [Marinobacter]|uniref:cation:proton antiporter n=1 Tax=Marinobacter TaxID=2742 RepID=UPI0014875D58|nr:MULTISPECIES: cation:proton antiporter [Marinobacter]